MLVVAFFSILSLTFVWLEVTSEPVQAAVIVRTQYWVLDLGIVEW